MLSSVDIDKMMRGGLIDHIISQGEEFLIPQYKDENYLYDVEDEDIDREDFKSWAEEDVRIRLEDLVRFYKSNIIENGKLVVWRKITVTEDWINHLQSKGKHLGIYWSWDPEATDTHWGDFSKRSVALIEAEVSENGVDWEKTLRSNVEPSIGEEEKEITLNKGVPVKILSIEVDGKPQDISSLQGKEFYS